MAFESSGGENPNKSRALFLRSAAGLEPRKSPPAERPRSSYPPREFESRPDRARDARKKIEGGGRGRGRVTGAGAGLKKKKESPELHGGKKKPPHPPLLPPGTHSSHRSRSPNQEPLPPRSRVVAVFLGPQRIDQDPHVRKNPKRNLLFGAEASRADFLRRPLLSLPLLFFLSCSIPGQSSSLQDPSRNHPGGGGEKARPSPPPSPKLS